MGSDKFQVFIIIMEFLGITKKGAGRGKKIGFPTINLDLLSSKYEEGVFAVRGNFSGKKFQGIAHFGPRPTFADKNLSVEIHIFDFAGKVSERTQVKFETIGEKIRGIQKFDSEQDLKKQIEQDCRQARLLLKIQQIM